MKILMVTSSYPLHPGDGTAPFIESIARGVAARGHQVEVILPEHRRLARPADDPIRFHPYRYAPAPSWALWGYAQSLQSDVKVRPQVWALAPLVALGLRGAVSERLSNERFDALHVHWVVPNAALVSDLAAAHRTPLVISLHGSDVFMAERLAPARALARAAFARAGAVTACSGDLHARALALGAPAARTRTVPYGVDAEAFAPAAGDRSDVRRAFGVPESARLVAAVGRLVEKKGFVHLVEAAATVPGLHVVVAGDGDLEEPLRARARALNAPVTLAGRLPRERVAALMAAADLVAVPSVVDREGNVDGLPNVLLEALAAGRAVVASRTAGIPDVITDDVTGLLVPPGDAPALAAALRRLLAEPDTRTRLGRAARALAVDTLGWDVVARTIEECYVDAAALVAR